MYEKSKVNKPATLAASQSSARTLESELRARIRSLEADVRDDQQQQRIKLQEQEHKQQELKRSIDSAQHTQHQLRGSLTMTRWISGLFFLGLCSTSVLSYAKFQDESQLQTNLKAQSIQMQQIEQKRLHAENELQTASQAQITMDLSYQAIQDTLNSSTLLLAANITEIEKLNQKIEVQQERTQELEKKNTELKESLDQSRQDLSVKETALDEKDEMIHQLKSKVKDAKEAISK